MCKKVSLGVLGLLLIAGLLFGGKLIPYGQTAYQKISDAANESVPVEFQLDAAKNQLKRIGPEIKNMVHQVAKETVQIKKLAADLERQEEMLVQSKEEMMTLREHLESSDEYFVATNSQKYNRSRVEQDLRHRFTLYQTHEATMNKQREILSIRRESLQSALAKLDEAKAQQRELEVKIENLNARNRMNEVIATASQINIDNSELAKTREMLEDIDARISAKEEVLNIAPKYYGQIPVNPDTASPDSDILDDMDAYFQKSDKKASDDDLDNFDL